MTVKTVDELVKSTLKKLGVPVSRVFDKNLADTHITYQLIFSRSEEFCDDDNIAKSYLYRASIYSKKNYLELVEKVERILKDAGFHGITISAEIYENETDYFHIPIEFYVNEEV